MEKHTVLTIQKKKDERSPIVMLTCYDAATARLLDQAGVDVALVGDSLANTRLGYENTLPVTLEEMLHHVKAAARGNKNALLVADMPFQTYEATPWQAVMAAGRFIKEGGAQAVKVEGASRISESIKAILRANIPVMGHLGLTPQSIYQEGGYRVHGKKPNDAKALIREAKLLESLGAFAVVLECIPLDLARRITKMLKIPTIGIGAGPYCDGQVLVFDDVMGLTEGPTPKFVAPYAKLRPAMLQAIENYRSDVLARKFPTDKQSYH